MKRLGLRFARRMVAVIVEPDLADGDDLRMSGEALEDVEIELARRFMRMKAHHGVHAVVLLGDLERARPRLRVRPDREDPRHTGSRRARDHAARIIECVEVRVGVDHAVSRCSSSSTIPGSSLRKSGSGSFSFWPAERRLGSQTPIHPA